MQIANGSENLYNLRKVRMRLRGVKTVSNALRVRMLSFAGSRSHVETFSSATSRLPYDFTFDTGDIADLLTTGGVATSVANHGVEKRARWFGANVDFTGASYGPVTDGGTWAAIKYAQVLGHKGGTLIKAVDASNYIEGYLTDDGTNSILNLDKVVAGVRTNIATSTLGARLADAANYWVRTKIQGEVVVCDYFTSAPSTTTLSASGATTITATLTVKADIDAVGSRVQGWSGFSWVPGSTSSTMDNLQHVRAAVHDIKTDDWVLQDVRPGRENIYGVTHSATDTSITRFIRAELDRWDTRMMLKSTANELASALGATWGAIFPQDALPVGGSARRRRSPHRAPHTRTRTRTPMTRT